MTHDISTYTRIGCVCARDNTTNSSQFVTIGKHRGNGVFLPRLSESLIALEPIVKPQKPPAGVHVAVATYLCTLRLF